MLKYSKTEAFRNAAVGLRGWRVRSDLHWGVPQEELDDHVADGWRLAEPFRVGVLTANEGYLIRPRFFVATLHEDTGVAPLASKVSVLDLEQLNASAVHLVDDIWLNGHLATQRIERYVVPLNGVIRPAPSLNTLLAGSAIPSIDVTKAHTLQGRILREGYTRTTADWVALQLFKDAWRKEDLFYRTKGERRQMTGPEALSCVPRYHAGVASIKAQLLKSYHHIYVRLIFGQ